MEMIFNHPEYWNLLWIVTAVAVLVIAGIFLRRRAIDRFAGTKLQPHLLPRVSSWRRWTRAGLFVLAMLLMAGAMTDPRWGKKWAEIPQKGVDVIFALDVSRSMLAGDVSPNRLSRAKQYICDMMDEMGGDRVGLVVFAGKTKQKVPLTSNYSDVKMALEEIDTQSVGRGGSLIGDAIRTAAGCFVDKTADHKAIVVITDGEDHESYPVEAARRALRQKGIRVYTVGLGDMSHGSRIPVRRTGEGTFYLKQNGQEVWTKLDGKMLEKTALAGGGAYIPAGTRQVDMAEVYRRHIAAIAQREFRQARVNRYIPRYQWLVGLALGLLLIETLLASQWKNRGGKELVNA
ncbi:MAG: VWA domain-containing protein [Phycisphaerae bacterium]|nr:VWA domain-containing protein [Phycisphaerae bacterium]